MNAKEEAANGSVGFLGLILATNADQIAFYDSFIWRAGVAVLGVSFVIISLVNATYDFRRKRRQQKLWDGKDRRNHD